MTDTASSLMAILFGLGVFAIIVAVGWRSVQNRRLLRLQGADGQATIIIAGEGDDISVVTAVTETSQPAEAPVPAMDVEADAVGCDRLSRVVASTQ